MKSPGYSNNQVNSHKLGFVYDPDCGNNTDNPDAIYPVVGPVGFG